MFELDKDEAQAVYELLLTQHRRMGLPYSQELLRDRLKAHLNKPGSGASLEV